VSEWRDVDEALEQSIASARARVVAASLAMRIARNARALGDHADAAAWEQIARGLDER
jgi:hypothetical protein